VYEMNNRSFPGRAGLLPGIVLIILVGAAAQDAQPVRTLEGQAGKVWSVVFSPNGEWLASGSDDGIQLWNPDDGSVVREFPGHSLWTESVAFSPDGQLLASGGGDPQDEGVKLWPVDGMGPVQTLRGHIGSPIRSVAFSPDGTLVASASDNTTIELWNVGDATLVRTLKGHTDVVWSVAFSPDGTLLASGSADGAVKLWQVEDGSLVRTLRGHSATNFAFGGSVWEVAFSPDGQLLASGGADGVIKLWQVEDGSEVLSLPGHQDEVTSPFESPGVNTVTFSPDGQLLASGGTDDLTVKLWRVEDGSLIATFRGHQRAIYSVAFSPDGELLASSSDDTTIKLWRVD
jgi:WD40 repeat protein